jgi:hypothetical protein
MSIIDDDDYDYRLDPGDSYRDNPLLKKSGVKVNFTQPQVEEYIKCAKDPVYFAENYIKIVNVDRGLMPFEMWDFQKEMIKVYHENRFSITKCPRQVGKCVHINTPIRLKNKITGKIIETTIGEFYEQQKAKLLSEE